MKPARRKSQQGLVLLLSLTLVLLLGLLGLSAMGSAIQQERMARNLRTTLQTFEQAQQVQQAAESAVSAKAWPLCSFCLPPPEAAQVTAGGVYAGSGASSGLSWQIAEGGFFLVQFLGQSSQARQMSSGLAANLYRVTAVRRDGMARSVLESVVAQPLGPPPQPWQRILWRQIH